MLYFVRVKTKLIISEDKRAKLHITTQESLA